MSAGPRISCKSQHQPSIVPSTPSIATYSRRHIRNVNQTCSCELSNSQSHKDSSNIEDSINPIRAKLDDSTNDDTDTRTCKHCSSSEFVVDGSCEDGADEFSNVDDRGGDGKEDGSQFPFLVGSRCCSSTIVAFESVHALDTGIVDGLFQLSALASHHSSQPTTYIISIAKCTNRRHKTVEDRPSVLTPVDVEI